MEGTRLRIVTASDPNYMRTLEAAVRVGEPMLLKVGLLYCMCVCAKIIWRQGLSLKSHPTDW